MASERETWERRWRDRAAIAASAATIGTTTGVGILGARLYRRARVKIDDDVLGGAVKNVSETAKNWAEAGVTTKEKIGEIAESTNVLKNKVGRTADVITGVVEEPKDWYRRAVKAAGGRAKPRLRATSRMVKGGVTIGAVKMLEAAAQWREYRFGNKEQERAERGRFANPLGKFVTGDDLSQPIQTANYVWNRAKDVERTYRRGSGLAADLADVARGRPRQRDAYGRERKREWEKPWVGRAARGAAIAASLAGGGLLLRKNPAIGGKKLKQWVNAGLDKVAARAPKSLQGTIHRQKLKRPGYSPKQWFEAVHLESVPREDWEIMPLSRKQARVAAPGSGRRIRRLKDWTEKVENERKLWAAGVAGAGLLGAGGAYAAYRWGQKRGQDSVAPAMLPPAVMKPPKTTRRPRPLRALPGAKKASKIVKAVT